ncbi:MAG: hypothetical protein KF901_33895, partial [Myxococcales bacterium]|nr:hypothetical protein [Myxococcales bacterium]
MRNLGRCWAPLVYVAALTGCGGTAPAPDDGGSTMMEDGGGRDGGDRCMGRVLCSTAGTSCDGDRLVTCALDMDGCLVETRTDCGASGDICDASAGGAACVDRCSVIPEADRCETEGARACDGTTLEVCAMDAAGCLALERTECAEAAGGACDPDGAMPMCVLPADPCASIPAEDRCSTAGTSCDGDELLTCAADAFGCLVTTRADCASRADGTCGDVDGVAACEFATDPCDGVAQCGTDASARCDGPDLVECARDAFGCFVETRTACTDAPFGFCDPDAAPAPICSTAALDPCLGIMPCGTEPSRECTGEGTLEVCAANAFGCFVLTATSCAATSDVCSTASGTAMCVDPCSLVEVCPAATYCDLDERVTCVSDANGCLVETTREACDDTCDLVGGAAECVETACPIAAPGILDCASGTVNGSTTEPNGSALNPGNYGSCYTGTGYGGREQYWRFRNRLAGPTEVRVVATRGSGSSADFDLFVLDADDEAISCTPGTDLACLGASRGVTATETVTFR